jgi:hypothetical protein
MRGSRIAWLALVGLPVALAASAAGADTDVPAAGPAPPPAEAPGAPPDDERWHDAYASARERLLAGDFAKAAERFDALAATARDPVDRALATSMRDVARSWADRGLALVRQSALGESTLSAKSVGERTTDEITQLYVSSILYGIGTGLWLDAHTQPSSAAAAVLPALGFAGLAAGGVAVLDVTHPLHYGQPQAIVSGLNIGLEEGIVLALWDETRSGSGTQWSGQTVADVVWSLSTLGAFSGAVVGTVVGTTPGRASFVGSAALWSSIVAGLAGVAATPPSGDQGGAGLMAALVGLNAGLVGGLFAAGPVSPTIGRVRFLDIGGIGGGLLFGGVALAISGSSFNAQLASGLAAVGAATGLGVAWFATAKMPADRPFARGYDAHALSIQPVITPVAGGATLGVGGGL